MAATLLALLMLLVLFVFAMFATAHMMLVILVHAKGACCNSSSKAASAPHHHLVAAVPVGLGPMLSVPAAHVHAQETICRQSQELVSVMCTVCIKQTATGVHCLTDKPSKTVCKHRQPPSLTWFGRSLCTHRSDPCNPQHADLKEVSLGRGARVEPM